MTIIRYVPRIPKKIPAGLALVHNFRPTTPDQPIGLNGFRCFYVSARSIRLVQCRCGWAPALKHYRLRRPKKSG